MVRGFFIVILVTLNSLCMSTATESPAVETPKGRLTGKYLTSRNGNTYEAFVGIQYATIPGRFQNSVPSPGWEGTKNATEFGPVCPQTVDWQIPGAARVVGEEECLFLNVYTPKANGKKRPVLVFIHGGGFVLGNGDTHGAKYFMDEEIVLVTINYRLGILGFLNTGDGEVSGNMGLKDQVQALKWIRENIEAFGGDKSRVTISGESAGAVSVLHLILSPTTKGLFHAAIAQSGTASNIFSFRETLLPQAVKAGQDLKCETSTTAQLVACLKEIPVTEVLGSHGSFTEWIMNPLGGFVPSLEIKSEHNPEPFLEDSPDNLIQAGKFNRVPLLMTVDREEGAMWGAIVSRTPDVLKDFNENWERIAPTAFMFGGDPRLEGRSTEIAQKVRKFYFDNQEFTPEQEEILTDLYSDIWFNYAAHETALKMAQYTPVYTGLISYRRKDFNILTAFFGIKDPRDITAHGDELPYLYSSGNPESPVKATVLEQEVVEPDDVAFSKGLVKTFTIFAATGVPEVALGNSPKWSPVSKVEQQTRQLNWLEFILQPVLNKNAFQDRMTFWDKIYGHGKKDEL